MRPGIDQPLLFKVLVEQCMDAAVCGFLPDKSVNSIFHFQLLLRRQFAKAGAH
jgi:hypothetical protein